MKALVGAFNQEKALVGAFSVIVKTGCGTDGSFYSTAQDLVQRFRYFDLAQLDTVTRPAVCCVCRGADNSPAHLAQHSADTLVMIGLIEVMKQTPKYFYYF